MCFHRRGLPADHNALGRKAESPRLTAVQHPVHFHQLEHQRVVIKGIWKERDGTDIIGNIGGKGNVVQIEHAL